MTTQHTPGPWIFGIRNYDDDCKPGFVEKPFGYVSPGYYDNAGIFGADGTEIVGCDEYSIFNSPADARLIAAAPDLLEALKKSREGIESMTTWEHADDPARPWSDCLKLIDAAIAKATGAS